MKQKELSNDESMEILKKYDPKLYNYYYHNFWYFGYNARNYAAYLKRNHEKEQENMKGESK